MPTREVLGDFVHELSDDEFDKMLIVCAKRRQWGFPGWKHEIEYLLDSRKAKVQLQYHGDAAYFSLVSAYERAFKYAYHDEWHPDYIGLVPEERRYSYAEELAHACLEIKYHWHVCGCTPVLMNNWAPGETPFK